VRLEGLPALFNYIVTHAGITREIRGSGQSNAQQEAASGLDKASGWKFVGEHSGEVFANVIELIRQVKAFQHVRETGEATPSGWQPGKPTLKPGPELVGQVWKKWKPESAF
jgi:hypothetical protein